MDDIYISDWFADQYADRTPPWGFNGLGYVVFKRTYARPIFMENTNEVIRTEEWHEAVQRVVNGAQEIGADYTEEELIRLYDMIFNLKMFPGGRMLWQLGTPNTSRLGGDSLVNCLGGETEVVTREGIQRLDDLADVGYATVMTDYGKWVTADVLNFGEQPLAEVHLRRGRQTKTVRATAEHRWIVRGRNGREERLTQELLPGMKLVSIKGQGTKTADMSNDGVRAGLVFGDGTVYDTGSRAFVAYNDLPELEHLFMDYKSVDNGSGSVFYGLPRAYKAAPDYNEFRGYLYGWLAGYFAADGYARDGKGAQINSTKLQSLQVAKDVATIIGVATGPIYSQERVSNLTGTESTIYTLPLHIEDPEFFLLTKHRGAFEGRSGISDWKVESVGEYGEPEPVFCAVVPDTHTFALADNLLTGNCWFVDISKPSDFSWSVERLMLGGGVGFACNHPERLGVVRSAYVERSNVPDADFIVPDTREGWANLIRKVIEAYVGGDDHPRKVIYNTQHIRPAGVPIKTFGGTASGPAILVEGVSRITEVLDGAVGRELTSVEVMDIMNIIGSIVVAGNVRRSAEIALGDIDDEDYLMAKRWDLGRLPKERAMSNNSLFVTAEQMKNLPEMVWEGYRGKGEPYGFFNLETSRTFGRMGEARPDPTIVGVNPCAEIPLGNRESCNLAEIVLPNIESQAELEDAAILLYKLQKAVAALSYIDPQSDRITSQNMRLGGSITGIAQALDKVAWCDETYNSLREFDKEWSEERGWPESVRLTTVKPSGTLSLLAGVTPGVHPGFSQYFVKRMRMGADSPLIDYCRDKGYHVEPVRNFDGTEDHRTVVVEFPCAFPEGTLLAKDMSAVQQMDLVRLIQRVWADNAVSVTVYYHGSELDEIREYLKNHWGEMKSVSFLLHSEHGFDQAPMGELTKEEYEEMLANTSPLGERISGSTFITEDEMAATGEQCDTGSCPLR